MSSNKRVWLAGAALLLLLSGLGCSLCPLIPTGATPTPPELPTPTERPTPTSTPTPEPGEMTYFQDPRSGISLMYPEDWVYESDDEAVYLAPDDDALMNADPQEGPLFAAASLPPEDLAGYQDLDTAQGIIDAALQQMMASEGGCSLGDAEAVTFGTVPGGRAQGTCEDPEMYLLLGAAYNGDLAGLVVAAAPIDEWDAHGDTLEAIFASVQFSAVQAIEPVGMGEIAPGQTVQGTLPTDGIHSWYFEGQEGTYATIDLRAGRMIDLDPYLQLYDPDGFLLASDDDGGEGYNSLIMLYPMGSSGRHEIQVSALGGEGEYSLSLQVASEAPPGGGAIEYGESVTGTLVWGGEHEWTFEGEEGDRATISMCATAGGLDSYLELYGPDGEQLAEDDDSAGGLDSLIECYELPADGTYTIVCSGFGQSSGIYQLTLGTGAHGTLSIGETVTDALQERDRHNWLFEGSEGDVVTISLVASNDEFDAYLELFGPDGEQLATDDDGGQGYNSMIEGFELPATGEYRIVARSLDGSEEGEYELTLSAE
jgi:hypothetical protein